jgi:hypothetical protein
MLDGPAVAVHVDAYRADSDREGVDAVMRQGWAVGLERRAR